MPKAVRAIPEGYHTITPQITCRNAQRAIEYYKQVFGATELNRAPGPDGKIMHAELQIGDSRIMLNDEFPGMNEAPDASKPSSSSLFFYTENVDAVFERAVKAGATVKMPVTNMFWGDRYGTFNDPFGHRWGIATHVEDVAPDEMQRRMEEAAKQMGKRAAAGQGA